MLPISTNHRQAETRGRCARIRAHDADRALALAALELERRFGRLTKALVPADGGR